MRTEMRTRSCRDPTRANRTREHRSNGPPGADSAHPWALCPVIVADYLNSVPRHPKRWRARASLSRLRNPRRFVEIVIAQDASEIKKVRSACQTDQNYHREDWN